MAKYHPWKSRKFLVTAVSTTAVLVGEWFHPGFAKNLEIILPALILAYCGANAHSKRYANLGDTNGSN